jgi:hypothetical protein
MYTQMDIATYEYGRFVYLIGTPDAGMLMRMHADELRGHIDAMTRVSNAVIEFRDSIRVGMPNTEKSNSNSALISILFMFALFTGTRAAVVIRPTGETCKSLTDTGIICGAPISR